MSPINTLLFLVVTGENVKKPNSYESFCKAPSVSIFTDCVLDKNAPHADFSCTGNFGPKTTNEHKASSHKTPRHHTNGGALTSLAVVLIKGITGNGNLSLIIYG